MIEIKLDNKVYEIKTKASEITINELMKSEEIMSDNTKVGLDEWVEIIQLLSNLTVEEIEDLPMATLKEVMTIISTQDFALDKMDFRNEFVLLGVKYKNKAKSSEEITFSVKEIFRLKEQFKVGKADLTTIAGVIFREVDKDGNISRDLSDESIRRRSKLMGELTLDLILPYVNDIQNHLN